MATAPGAALRLARGPALGIAVLMVLGLGLARPAVSHAQAADTGDAGTPYTESLELDPIRCWWRVGAAAVRVGEPFAVVLTCSVVDTSSTTVAPDRSRLDASVVQLSPFEVTGGAPAVEFDTPTHDFFQYEYTLRYIGEDFGTDVELPSLSISYRVLSRVSPDGAAVEGREQAYVLPAQTVRILSLVPAAARDIREQAPDTFQAVQARQFRARSERLASTALFGLAGIVALWAAVAAVRRPRAVGPRVPRELSPGTVLRAVSGELGDIARERGATGWTPQLAARALGALRITASYAATGHASQRIVTDPRTPVAPGQLPARRRLGRGRRVLVSGAATPRTLEAESVRRAAQGEAPGHLADLASALREFSVAAYGREGAPVPDLDDALSSGRQATAREARRQSWLARQVRATGNRLTGMGARVWAR
ncbi:MAG: hypothetical protein AB7G23_01255 [Vicinamibacterales bacterium]